MKKIIALSCLLAASTLAITSFAATQGTLGPTSTGSTTITLTIPNEVQITALSDITLGTVTDAADGNTTACIYSNDSGGGYKVTVTGDGVANAFTVKNPSNDTITYTAFWNDQTAGDGVIVTTGSALNGQTGANTTDPLCDGTGSVVPNAKLTVKFSKTDIDAAFAGAYSGVATILIEPS